MASHVYLTRCKLNEPIELLQTKLGKLLDASGTLSIVSKNDMVLVKVTFGEAGNRGYVNPRLIKVLVDRIKTRNGRPFVADTNTLYKGRRSDAQSHLLLAAEHGFSTESLGAPVMIADGLVGENQIQVRIDGIHTKLAHIAGMAGIVQCIIGVAHVTGHMVTGMGAAVKNIGMGLSTRGGKLFQHSGVIPQISPKICNGCGVCKNWCPVDAIAITESPQKDAFKKKSLARIDSTRCTGCGECLAVCPSEAVKIAWDESNEKVQEKMAEFCLAALSGKQHKAAFINFAWKITKNCDCMAKDDPPMSPDVGILASFDPVALDKASYDVIVKTAGFNPFTRAYPDIDPLIQLRHGARIGLGSLQYTLCEVS